MLTLESGPARLMVAPERGGRIMALSVDGLDLLAQIDRDPVIDGCGCPTIDKAKSPEEHCPLNARHQPAITNPGRPSMISLNSS